MLFTTALQSVKTTIDEELRRFFTQKRRQAQNIHPQTVQLVDQLRDLTLRGGKRTRAFLVWLGYEAAVNGKRKTKKARLPDGQGKIENKVLSAMMAMELFQTFALIHDDIIDEDTVRRGGPTAHESFRINALTHSPSNPSLAKHFGESMAILAGDLSLAWADEEIAKLKTQMSKLKTDPQMMYQKMKEEVIFGQSLDVLASIGLPSADRTTINRYKTAWYSVIRPLQIGAAIGGANEDILQSFVPYGLAVGEAYQLRDDVFDGAITEIAFKKKAAVLQKRVEQAIKTLQVFPAGATPGIAHKLLADFARFAQDRRA